MWLYLIENQLGGYMHLDGMGETMGRDGEKVKIHKLEELRGPTGT